MINQICWRCFIFCLLRTRYGRQMSKNVIIKYQNDKTLKKIVISSLDEHLMMKKNRDFIEKEKVIIRQDRCHAANSCVRRNSLNQSSRIRTVVHWFLLGFFEHKTFHIHSLN